MLLRFHTDRQLKSGIKTITVVLPGDFASHSSSEISASTSHTKLEVTTTRGLRQVNLPGLVPWKEFGTSY